jgi:hypothetical protein
VIAFAVDAGRITEIDIIRNPDKLTRVPSMRGPVTLDLPPRGRPRGPS